ncbi:MAG: hypothetical protein KAS66_15950 [Candidatus Omnitrophica bacterium]|nr:hypothetical protein [Candidatus Omnitrophota bacterium]
MKYKPRYTISLLVLWFLVMMPFTAQSAKTTQVNSGSVLPSKVESRIMELEKKLFQLKTTQEQLLASLNSSNEQYRFLVTAFSVVLGSLVAIGALFQGFVTFFQLRVQNSGAKQVSDIMDVVEKTIKNRLDAEEEARNEATKTHNELDIISDRASKAIEFLKIFRDNIQKNREAIEDNAIRLAKTPRHNFRSKVKELKNFADQFDMFQKQYMRLEEESHPFSSKTRYIRGIAAHYDNQPEIAKQHLNEVIEAQQPEAKDTQKGFKRRVANAYYYIGITESNFGNTQASIDAFDQANLLDPEGMDFLTKVVKAEVYAMGHEAELDKVYNMVQEILTGLNEKEKKDGKLDGVYLRLKSRATLVHANTMIQKGEKSWLQKAEKYLMSIYDKDPGYYYSTATLAQISFVLDKHDQAKRLFQEAYDAIEHSDDLSTVQETRSKILLRMVMAICCRHGIKDEQRSEEYFLKADELCESLPKMGSQICTVFSPFSKHNEIKDTVHNHIKLMRGDEVLSVTNV